MNKIILIGNGFDLAHGLKVKYTDFLNNVIEERVKNPNREQSLFEIRKTYPYENPLDEFEVDYSKSPITNYSLLKKKNKSVRSIDNRVSEFFKVSLKNNDFFNKLLVDLEIESWGGFEQAYYDSLTDIERLSKKAFSHVMADSEQRYIKQGDWFKGKVKKLNQDFQEIKEEFIKYLKTHMDEVFKRIQPMQSFNQWFLSPKFDHKKEEQLNPNSPFIEDSKLKPNRVLVLNFNYTQLPEKIYGVGSESNVALENYWVINIHGEVDNQEGNPIIFGYGDEMHESYSRLEDYGNITLEHFKSFQYAKTANLHKVEAFVESDIFQVDILGHGCGKCDRVLLNYIFEHNQCNRIRIHYHGDKKEYDNIYMNLSRHFSLNKKQEMRSKVIEVRNDHLIPQGHLKQSK